MPAVRGGWRKGNKHEAADFDGPDALADALMYVKAARALQVPAAALEVSRSGLTTARSPPKSATTSTNTPGVLASSLAKRAPGYVSLGFPVYRRLHGRTFDAMLADYGSLVRIEKITQMNAPRHRSLRLGENVDRADA